jgi:hypothetical protein
MTSRPSTGRLRLVAVVVLALVVVAACQVRLTEQGHENGVGARNDTESILHFRTLVEGLWYDLGSVSPGNLTQAISYSDLTSATSAIARDGCTIGVLVAFDPAGNEVARHDPALCVGDVWQIDAASD